MNILYVLDNNFISQVAASICSVCENNINTEIFFHVFAHNVTSDNENSLINFVNRYNQKIKIYELNDLSKYFNSNYDTLGWRPVILGRLVCDKILPSNVEKILYLDGDTIVIDSLSELYNTDLENCYIGACIEPTVDKQRKNGLGLKDHPYYNSGVLLIDLKKCRKDNIFPNIVEYYINNKDKIFAPDQDAINGYLKGKIYTLAPKYNFVNSFKFYPYKVLDKIAGEKCFVDLESYKDSLNNPVIIHFLGEERPWREGNTNSFSDQYIKYANKTPWGYQMEKGWSLYFFFWNIFNFVMIPFPMLRYKIINGLIPFVMKLRKNKIKNKE